MTSVKAIRVGLYKKKYYDKFAAKRFIFLGMPGRGVQRSKHESHRLPEVVDLERKASQFEIVPVRNALVLESRHLHNVFLKIGRSKQRIFVMSLGEPTMRQSQASLNKKYYIW